RGKGNPDWLSTLFQAAHGSYPPYYPSLRLRALMELAQYGENSAQADTTWSALTRVLQDRQLRHSLLASENGLPQLSTNHALECLSAFRKRHGQALALYIEKQCKEHLQAKQRDAPDESADKLLADLIEFFPDTAPAKEAAAKLAAHHEVKK